VTQGLMRGRQVVVDGKDALLRLWLHELTRQFCDRLTSMGDQAKFRKIVDD